MGRFMKFVTLDVFASKPYSGNPLAVVFLPNEDDPSNNLTQAQKQLITREFNLSETIFLHPSSGEKRTIDIFTKTCEVPFAGHPTIGAASWLLCHSNEEDQSTVRTLSTKAGDIPITLQDGNKLSNVVAAKVPHNVRIHTARFPLTELLRLHPSLAPFFPSERSEKTSFPVFSIVNGMSQVHGGEAVSITGGYLDKGWENGICHVYFYVQDVEDQETGEKTIRTRAIRGILEDPATGSAASGLASYLSLVQVKRGSYQYNIVQGVEMGRRSEIKVEVVMKEDDQIESVELKGNAVKMSEGSILVPSDASE